MGVSWAANLPIVDVPASAAPKRVTLIIPHYANRNWLIQQAAIWAGYPEMALRRLTVIVVDDCSPGGPPVDELRAVRSFPGLVTALDQGFELRLFALERDVRWNWLAARNIGAHHAGASGLDSWILLTDIDHVVPIDTLEALQAGAHDPKVIYGFTRVEYFGDSINPHPNSWFLTRSMFWRVGGYDEALSGYYGTDGEWRRRMAAVAPIRILREWLVRHERIMDSSTTLYERKQPEDAEVKRIIARRGPGWRPRTLSFPYHEVKL